MGLKEDFQNYKQRQEVKKFFRSNNEAFLSPKQNLLMAICCFGVAIVCGIGLELITLLLNIRFSFIYIIGGYLVAMTIRKFTNIPRWTTTLIGMVAYLLGIILGQLILIGFLLGSIQYIFSFAIIHTLLVFLINQDLFSILFIGIGIYTIYYLTN